MGFDDLAAILMVGDRLAGLSVVAGNVPLERAVASACATRVVFGLPVPVHAGAGSSLTGQRVTAQYVLGQDGMPGQGRKLPHVDDAPDGTDAVAALADWIDGGGASVLALGPLTNLARLLARRPDLAGRFRVVWMGGSAAGGNHTAAAEYNAAADPEAVAAVLASGVGLVMVGLDCCRQVTVTGDDVAPLRAIGTDRGQLLADLLDGYVGIAKGRPMALYDPVAAAAALDPSVLHTVPARVEAELHGTHTRGMTVVDWRARTAPPNAQVAVTAQATPIRQMVLAALLRAAR